VVVLISVKVGFRGVVDNDEEYLMDMVDNGEAL
jgi:hypothetical protein